MKIQTRKTGRVFIDDLLAHLPKVSVELPQLREIALPRSSCHFQLSAGTARFYISSIYPRHFHLGCFPELGPLSPLPEWPSSLGGASAIPPRSAWAGRWPPGRAPREDLSGSARLVIPSAVAFLERWSGKEGSPLFQTCFSSTATATAQDTAAAEGRGRW